MAVTPLDYRQMRLLSEVSLSQTGGPTTYVVANGAVELIPSDQAPPADGVLVQTLNTTKHPRLGYLTMQVPVAGADGTSRLVPLDLVRLRADAVFWSDAAVKKFVQPYAASCAGYHASDALDALRLAWNGVSTTAQVFALLHVTWVDPGAPTAMEPLWVAFVHTAGDQAGQAGALPISRYNEKFAPTLPMDAAPAVTVSYERPLPNPGAEFFPGYAGLRGVAEWSMSLNGQPRYFLFDPVTNSYSPPSTTLPPVVGSQVVFPVYNRTVPSQPLIPQGVWLQPPGDAAPVDLAGKADAVFWSTGAIEQFMLPYYASVDGFAGLKDLLAISAAWNADVPGGGGGLPVGPQVDADDGASATLLDGSNEVYGLVHLPQSAWVSLEESLASEEIAMVHHSATGGGTAVTRARDFVRGARRSRR